MLNCYELLGVGETATPEEIRRAYIELMKRHHPDAPGSDPESEALARDLNKAFWTLRSPARRAGHDRLLRQAREDRRARASSQPRGRPLPAAAVALAGHPPQRKGRALGLLIAAVAIVGTGYVVQQPQRGERLWELLFGSPLRMAARAAAESGSVEAGDALPQVDGWNVSGAVSDLLAIVFQSGMPAAERYSRRCFEEAAAAPSPRLVDHCVAFDTAAALVDEADARAERRPASEFYSGAARESRFVRVASALPGAAQDWRQRRRDIERRATSALAELGGPVPPPAEAALSAASELGAQ